MLVFVIVHNISKATVAPTKDVILLTSKGGDTSTTSAPIKLIFTNVPEKTHGLTTIF